MDRLHVLCTKPAAAAFDVAAGARVSFGPAIPFGPVVSFSDRLWWYDVHQVEGAV
jgi:hypothetical protein